MDIVNFLMPLSFILLALGMFVFLRSIAKKKWALVIIGLVIMIVSWFCFAGAINLRKKVFREQPAKMYLEKKPYDSMTQDEKKMLEAYYTTVIKMDDQELELGIPTYIYYGTQVKMNEYNIPFDQASEDIKNSLDSYGIDYSDYEDVFESIPK